MKKLILKQAMMNKVLYALAPLTLMAIYLYGWRVLAVLAVTNGVGFLTEYMFIRKKKMGKVSMAVFVTGTLVGLIMPPAIPLWIAGVASLFGVAFGKMVFGGFGLNIFNPAIVGRAFVYVSFPQQMATTWSSIYSGFPGGFLHFKPAPILTTSATLLAEYNTISTFNAPLWKTFTGLIPGSIGETSALLIILAGIYLLITKTAKWQAMASTLIGFIATSLIFFPPSKLPYFLCGAGLMFGVVFMVTDPVSQPKHPKALWIYGIMVGFLTVFIRRFSLFAEGFMFALLLANCFMPLIDYFFLQSDKKKKAMKVA